jgi:hypothetical protein
MDSAAFVVAVINVGIVAGRAVLAVKRHGHGVTILVMYLIRISTSPSWTY